MADNSEQTDRLQSSGSSRFRTIWWDLVWPALIITSIGSAGILFLICCARVSELELQTGELSRQIKRELATQRRLSQQLAQLQDRARLRDFAQQAGMVFSPEGTDLVQVPDVSDQDRPVSPVLPYGEALASRPKPDQMQPPPDEDAVIAEMF